MADVYESNEMSVLDYVTASAVHTSKTKPDCKKIWGLDGLQEILKVSRHPVTAIGGITVQNARQIMNAGASGVAVIGAVHDYKDPYLAACNLTQELNCEQHQKSTKTRIRI